MTFGTEHQSLQPKSLIIIGPVPAATQPDVFYKRQKQTSIIYFNNMK